ncbi:glycosyltransferase family 1 protein [Faecalicatena contorta]|uniref:hypothetical protein n=1 Tax=Faecalicatena contorta TaxID=39482 RepID=UPI00129D25D2|nr:hypothetical protein [Faecalicatena contorta]MRM90672.1 glycosyltransferase family 1 protein [Faecalicatena contorta]
MYESRTLKRGGQIYDLVSGGMVKTVITPSKVALNQWKKAYPSFKGTALIIPHQKRRGVYRGNNKRINENETLKIAYIGAPLIEKGWNYWNEAIKKAHEKGCREEFHVFGAIRNNPEYVVIHEITFQNGLNSMITALRRNEIHCVVLGSIVKETYSYTYFESLASNAFVITNLLSGNIAYETKKNKNGIVLNRPDDLSQLFLNENDLRNKINNYRKREFNVPLELVENDDFIPYISNKQFKCEVYIEKKNLTWWHEHLKMNLIFLHKIFTFKLKSLIKVAFNLKK